MGKTVEINLNLATVGTELVETINQIQEGLTAQFVRVSRNLNRIGKEIVHDVGSFFKDLVQAVQKGDWKKIFTFFDQGEELLARIKAYIGQLKESISGYVALDLKKILPEEGLNEVKRRVTAFTQFFADLKKSFAARDWEGVARYLLPEEIFTSVLQVKAGVGKAKEWVNSIKRAFMEEGLEAVFKQALPEDIFDQILRGKELYQKTKEWINEIKQAFMDGGIQEVLQKIFSQDFRENLLQTFGNLREWMQQIPTVFTEAFSNITMGLGNFFTQITGDRKSVV